MRPRLALLALAWPLLLGAHEEADIIFYNGKIITVAAKQPLAQAVAIRGNRFLAVGSNEEVLKLAGPSTRKYDLKGRAVVPGIVESHTHPASAAFSEQDGPVPVMKTIAEIQAYIRQQATRLPPERLIFVPKVYPSRLKEGRYPLRRELDEAAPNRLVMADNGYASVLSTPLMAKLGITRDSPQPANGKIIKDERGEPIGLVLGAPQLLGQARASRPRTYDDLLWAIPAMQAAYNKVGITSTIDRGQGAEGMRAYQDLRRQGKLSVRTTVTYTIRAQGTPEQVRTEIERTPLVTGMGDEWVRVGAIKTTVDGGILIGTALMREPWGPNTGIYGYVDPDYRGVQALPRENLIEMARTANRLGWQMTAHTAGGGAVHLLLDAYEAADRERPIRPRRFTVTHGNLADARAISRAAKMGVLFDCQIAWHHLDGPALKDVFGPERMRQFLPLRSFLDAGVLVAGGSDHMIRFHPRDAINPYHPFYGMWMAITRKAVDGSVLNPEQRVTREEALRMWTINGAYMSFEENLKGSIEPGKLADLVVIIKEYLTCPEDEIRDIEALLTMVDGKVVYSRLPLDGAGVSMGHYHLKVRNVSGHARLWVELFGATPGKLGRMEMLKLPGAVILVEPGQPTGGSHGSIVDEIGLKVRDLKATLVKAKAAGVQIVTERPEGRNAILNFPDDVRVEVTEDSALAATAANHHIHFRHPAVNEMKAWYVKLFGAAPGKRGRFEAADLPGVNLTFTEPETSSTVPTKGRSLDHIGFEVKNLEAFCKRLEAAGLKFDIPYRNLPELRLAIAFLTDPWGTYIELTEGLP
mgnify:CR=1 FL=1